MINKHNMVERINKMFRIFIYFACVIKKSMQYTEIMIKINMTSF